MKRYAVILSNMGGPDSLESVEPYLFNIFRDPDIIDIPVPEFLRIPLVRWLARKRGPESREIYEQIGGRSPLNDITGSQAEALEKRLNADGSARFTVTYAMRYWHPLFEDVWQEIDRTSFDRIIIVSLYPFYSTTTTGSLENLLSRLVGRDWRSDQRIGLIDRFGGSEPFIEGMADQIRTAVSEYMAGEEGTKTVLLSAHSIPMKRIRQGDPYADEVHRCMELLQQKMPPDIQLQLAFQSKIGPVKWLSPATPDVIRELADKGLKKLVVYPLGFVADNSETIYEIGILYRDLAHQLGIEDFHRVDALNTHPGLIDSLYGKITGILDKTGE